MSTCFYALKIFNSEAKLVYFMNVFALELIFEVAFILRECCHYELSYKAYIQLVIKFINCHLQARPTPKMTNYFAGVLFTKTNRRKARSALDQALLKS